MTASISTTAARRAIRHLALVAERAEDILAALGRDGGAKFEMATKSDLELFLPAALTASGKPGFESEAATPVARDGAEEAVRFMHTRRRGLARLGAPADMDLAAAVTVPGGGTVTLAEWLVAWDVHTSGLLGVASESTAD